MYDKEIRLKVELFISVPYLLPVERMYIKKTKMETKLNLRLHSLKLRLTRSTIELSATVIIL